MTLKRKATVLSIIYIAVSVIITMMFVSGYRKIISSVNKNNNAVEINSLVINFNMISQEYFINRTERTEDQLEYVLKNLDQLIKHQHPTISQNLYHNHTEEELRLLGSMEKDLEKIIALYRRLKSEDNDRIREKIIFEMIIASQQIAMNSKSVSISAQEVIKENIGHFKIISFVLVPLSLAYLFLSFLFLFIYIFKEIRKLSAAAFIIGSGDFEKEIIVNKKDEIGDLALSLNTMRVNLKNITASRDELNDVIKKRDEAENLLKESEEKFRSVVNSMDMGMAVHEMIFDEEGNSVDYRFTETNPSFELLTGLKRENIIGKTCLEVLPGIEKFWIENYGNVVKTGRSISFEDYSSELKKWYKVFAYKTRDNEFAVVIEDISAKKRSDDELKIKMKELKEMNNLMIDRELKMVELKEEINELLKAAGKPEKY
ncbi:MAG: HAMP domain-containing protein [Spirochaetes bacterium]|nr:HAMP domain-containing protein [Spirochaetota bacterium]